MMILQRIFFILLLGYSALFAKNIEVVPPSISFKSSLEADIIEDIYMTIHNGIGTYNAQQDNPSKLLHVKETFLPTKKYKTQLRNYYRKSSLRDKMLYMQKHHLSYLLEYRIKHSDIRRIRGTKNIYKVRMQLYVFTKDGKYKRFKTKLYFDTKIYALTDKSYNRITKLVLQALR